MGSALTLSPGFIDQTKRLASFSDGFYPIILPEEGGCFLEPALYGSARPGCSWLKPVEATIRYQKIELDFLTLYHPKIAGKTGS